MRMDISAIHFHDTQILRVIEDCGADTLTMEVEYPVDWERNVFEKRLLVFEGVHGYQVFDGPFAGYPTILDASIIGTEGRWSRLRLETNAGRRELSCLNPVGTPTKSGVRSAVHRRIPRFCPVEVRFLARVSSNSWKGTLRG